jgi:hypothetical protein
VTPLISALLLAAAASGVGFPAPGSYRYSASMGAQRIGEWTVSVKAQNADTEIEENSSASVAGMQLTATASLVLGADLAPLSYSGNYRTPMQSPSPAVTLTATSATVTGAVTSSAPRQLSLAANTHHFVVVEPGLLAGLFALPAQLAAWKETSVTWITPATGEAQELAVNPSSTQQTPSGVPSSDAVLSIVRPLVVTIWYDPTTLVPDEIAVPSQSAVLTRDK